MNGRTLQDQVLDVPHCSIRVNVLIRVRLMYYRIGITCSFTDGNTGHSHTIISGLVISKGGGGAKQIQLHILALITQTHVLLSPPV